MDYESTCPPSPGCLHHSAGGQRDHMATLEAQLLSYSENAENEGEDEYLEEKMLQVCSPGPLCHAQTHTSEPQCDVKLHCSACHHTNTRQVDMATLAEQIIEATPERIKQEDFPRGAESPLRERRDNPAMQDPWLATYLDTVDTPTHSLPR